MRLRGGPEFYSLDQSVFVNTVSRLPDTVEILEREGQDESSLFIYCFTLNLVKWRKQDMCNIMCSLVLYCV